MPLARIKSSVWWNYSRYVTRYFNFNRCRPRLQNLSLDGDHTIRYNPDNFKRTNVFFFFFLQQILPMLFYSCKVFYLVILLIRKLTKFCSYRQPDMILDLYVNCTWWKAPFGITDRPNGPTKKKKKNIHMYHRASLPFLLLLSRALLTWFCILGKLVLFTNFRGWIFWLLDR